MEAYTRKEMQFVIQNGFSTLMMVLLYSRRKRDGNLIITNKQISKLRVVDKNRNTNGKSKWLFVDFYCHWVKGKLTLCVFYELPTVHNDLGGLRLENAHVQIS